MFNDSPEHNKALQHNRKVLLDLLHRLNVTEVTIEYEGGGDSGSVTNIHVVPAGLKPPPLQETLTIQRVTTAYKNGQVHHGLREETVTLENALDDFVMSWVDMHHSGWENNEGGSGTATIDPKNDNFNLEHRTYYTETSYHDYAL